MDKNIITRPIPINDEAWNGVTVHTPENFDLDEMMYITGMQPEGLERYYSVDNPTVSLTLESSFAYTGERNIVFCEVTAKDENGERCLFGYDLDGKQIGSIDEVKDFIQDKFSGGFINEDDMYETGPEVDREKEEMRNAGIPDEYINDPVLWMKVPPPTQEELITDHMVKKADLPEHFEDQTEYSFAKIEYKDALGSGFIPFEMREGFEGGDAGNKITHEDVKIIRENYDDQFGMVMGIDTTKFDLSENGNVEVFDVQYQDVARYILMSDSFEGKFKPEAIEYIKAYSEKGEGIEVNGQDFKITNLVTVETKLKGDDTLYRNTMMIDDSGVVRGRFIFHDPEGPVEAYPDDYVAAFDKHRDLGAFERYDMMKAVEEKLPDFYRDFTARMDDIIDARKPFQEARLENYQNDKEAIRNIYNRIETYREIQAAAVAKAEYRLDNDVKRIKEVYEEKSGVAPGTEQSQELEQKYSSLKNSFIKSYHNYMKTAAGTDIQSLSKVADTVREAYRTASIKYDTQRVSIDALYSQITVDDKGNSFEDSYRKGLIANREISDKERFELLCSCISLKMDGFPEDRQSAEIISGWGLDEILQDADKTISDKVDEYNSRSNDMEKVYIDKATGQIYTVSGFRIEPHLSPHPNINVDQRPPEDRFDPNMIREDVSRLPLEYQPVTMGPTDRYERMSVQEYARSPYNEKGDTRASIAERFIEKGIYGRAPEEAVESSGRRDYETKKDSIAHLFSGEDSRYFKAVCQAIDKHVGDEKAPRRGEIEREKVPFLKELEKEERRENSKEGNVDSSSNDFSEDSKEAKYLKKSAMPYGKTDNSKDTEISGQKLKDLRQEAEKEANGDTDKAEKLYQEKCERLKAELDSLKKDIIHFDSRMESFSDIPFKWKSGHTYYQAAKLEYDSAIRKYVELGGAIGEKSFVQKGVSKLEAFAGRMDVLNSNILNTVILESLSPRVDRGYTGVYKDEDGNHGSYSKMNTFGKYFGGFFGNTVGQLFKGIALGMDKVLSHEKTDTGIDSKETKRDTLKENQNPDHIELNSDSTGKEDSDLSHTDSADASETLGEEADPVENEVSKSENGNIESEAGKDMTREENEMNRTDDSLDKKTVEDSLNEEDEKQQNTVSDENNDIDHVAEDIRQDKETDTDIDSKEDAIIADGNRKIDMDQSDPDDNPEANSSYAVDDESERAEIDANDSDMLEESDETLQQDTEIQETEDKLSAEGEPAGDMDLNEKEHVDDSQVISDTETTGAKAKDDTVSEDAVATEMERQETLPEDDLSLEITDDVVANLKGVDDSDMLTEKITDIISEDIMAPEDIMDAVTDGIIEVSADGSAAEGSAELVLNVCTAMDGSTLDNLEMAMDSLIEKGISDSGIDAFENELANIYESDFPYENDDYGTYDGYFFDDTGVSDIAAGDEFYFPDSYDDIEDHILADVDGMEYPESFNDDSIHDMEYPYDPSDIDKLDDDLFEKGNSDLYQDTADSVSTDESGIFTDTGDNGLDMTEAPDISDQNYAVEQNENTDLYASDDYSSIDFDSGDFFNE